MTGSLESRLASPSKARFIAGIISELVKLAYGVKVLNAAYFDEEQKKKPAMFAVKHQHILDYVASLYVFRRLMKKEEVRIPVKESLFRFKPLAALLRESGAVPIRRPTDEGYSTDMQSATVAKRELQEYFAKGGWYAYCPEGARKQGIVGKIDNSYILPVLLAARAGVDVYVVGVEYRGRLPLPLSPWIPFLTKVAVRFEKYEPKGKTARQAAQEVGEMMARLSGLEGKLETNVAPKAAVATAEHSTTRYN